MFSRAQKEQIAAEIETLLLSFNHPEMPLKNPKFHLRVDGMDGWSWADIQPNWSFDENHPPNSDPFTELSQ